MEVRGWRLLALRRNDDPIHPDNEMGSEGYR
jgi:hypothetical protein